MIHPGTAKLPKLSNTRNTKNAENGTRSQKSTRKTLLTSLGGRRNNTRNYKMRHVLPVKTILVNSQQYNILETTPPLASDSFASPIPRAPVSWGSSNVGSFTCPPREPLPMRGQWNMSPQFNVIRSSGYVKLGWITTCTRHPSMWGACTLGVTSVITLSRPPFWSHVKPFTLPRLFCFTTLNLL